MQDRKKQLAAAITRENGRLVLQGELNFNNVKNLYEHSLDYLGGNVDIDVDFSGVTSSDSAGLALIIEWVKLFKHKNRKISFHHLSAEWQAIAQAADLNDLVVNKAIAL